MSEVELRGFSQILGQMISKLLAETDLTDLAPGSVFLTLLEASAGSDFAQEGKLIQLLNLRNPDKAQGVDLENLAAEMGLSPPRLGAAASSVKIRISDSSFEKVSTTIFAGAVSPAAGDSEIKVTDASEFLAAGTIYLGRGTPTSEAIAYISKTDSGSFWTITFASPLTKDHLVGEEVVLAQGGDRPVNAGTIIRVPPSAGNPAIEFSLQTDTTLLDGESVADRLDAVSSEPGSSSNVGLNKITEFSAPPFSTALVENETPATGGVDAETDAELRQRIKDHVHELGRGTQRAIIRAVIGVNDPDEQKRVVSAFLREPTETGRLGILFIDDGTGFAPSFAGVGEEVIVTSATGTEQFFQLQQFPVVKAQTVSVGQEPFALNGGERFLIEIDGESEERAIPGDEYRTPGVVLAQEVAEAINRTFTTAEARAKDGRLFLTPAADDPDYIRIGIASSDDANDIIRFPIRRQYTVRLYKNDRLLEKNGIEARIQSFVNSEWPPFAALETLQLRIDGIESPFVTIADIDFLSLTASSTISGASPSDWAIVINAKFIGVTAAARDDGTFTIVSNRGKSDDASVEVIGGSLAGTLISATASAEGKSPEFKLNRLLGQIETTDRLDLNDELKAGTTNTEGFVETPAQSVFDLTLTLGTEAKMVVVTDSEVESVVFAQTFGALTFSSPASGVLRITGAIGQFDNVQIDDWCYTYNLPRNGLFRVFARTTSSVDLFDPDPAAGVDTPDGITKQIIFFRVETLPQEAVLPVGIAVSGQDVVDSFNDQIVGARAELLDSGIIRFKTLRLDGTGGLGIPVLAGTATNLGFVAGSFASNDPHTASAESADLAGLPSGKLLISVNDLVAPFDALEVAGTPFGPEHSNRPVVTYVGASQELIREPLERLSTNELTLRNEPPTPVVGLGPDARSSTTAGCEFGEGDNQVFIIDDDAAKKTFDIPMWVESTIAGPSVPNTIQFDAEDANGDLLGSSARWLGHRFEDYRCWFQSRADLPWSVANTELRVKSVKFGPNGKNLLVGFFYPTNPDSTAEIIYEIDAPNSDVLISMFLGSESDRLIGLTASKPISFTSTGPVLGFYTHRVQFVPPVDLSTVLIGDVMSVLDSAFSAANRGQSRVTAIDNLSDATRSYEHLEESFDDNVVTGNTNVVFSGVPTQTAEVGDKVVATAIKKSITAVSNSISATVTGFTATTVTVVVGQSFAAGGGTFVANFVTYTYTSYTFATGVFAGVTPDPTMSGLFIGATAVQAVTPTVTVMTGGDYDLGPSTIEINAISYTYTTYTTGSGVFDGVFPDPVLNGVTPGDDAIQFITPNITRLITVINTPSDFDVAGPGFDDGDGYVMDLIHKALTVDAPPSFVVAPGDKIQVASQLLTVTSIVSTTIFQVTPTFSFVGLASGTVSRIALEGARTTAGVNEDITSTSAQAVRVFPLAATTAQEFADLISGTAGVLDLIAAENGSGSDGSGVIVTSTEDELASGDLRVRLENGESFVYSTSAGSPALRIKEPADATPEIGEKIRLIPMTPQNISDHFNRKQISGLSVAANVELVSGARQVQVASKTPGGVGQVFAVGGTASGNNVIALKNTGVSVSSTIASAEFERAAIDLIAPGHTIFLSQTGRARKNYVGATPTAATTVEIQTVSPGVGRLVFGVPLVSTLAYTHTGTVKWIVRKISRGRSRFEILSGTATVPATLQADDWVFVGNGDSYAGTTPTVFFASANQGLFQVRETDGATYFDVDSEAADEIVEAASAPFVFSTYHSVQVGDQISIGDGAPLVSDNKGTFTITSVFSISAVDYNNADVVTEGPFALGVAGVDSVRILDQGYSTYRKVEAVAPNPVDPTNRTIVVMSPGYNISLLSESQSAKMRFPNRLGYGTDPVPGISGYQYWTGLKRRVQRVLDGYEPDPVNFPGVRAAGVSIEAREPQIQRVTLNIKVKTREGVALASISDLIKSSVVGFINSLGLGQDVVLSEIVSSIQAVSGVDSVVLVDPALNTERVVISDAAIARTSPSEIFLS
jgi:uncharacterized phage protein gp47/JayE